MRFLGLRVQDPPPCSMDGIYDLALFRPQGSQATGEPGPLMVFTPGRVHPAPEPLPGPDGDPGWTVPDPSRLWPRQAESRAQRNPRERLPFTPGGPLGHHQPFLNRALPVPLLNSRATTRESCFRAVAKARPTPAPRHSIPPIAGFPPDLVRLAPVPLL